MAEKLKILKQSEESKLSSEDMTFSQDRKGRQAWYLKQREDIKEGVHSSY